MTPREIDRKMWAHREESRRRHRSIVSTAWYTVMFDRQRRLPSLNTILNPAQKLTQEEQQAKQNEHNDLVRRMERG